MNTQQRTLNDLKTGVTVQIDKGGKLRLGKQPMMDLPSVKIIDMASIAQLEVLEKACVEFYCGMITKAQWRDAVRQSPEGQRLIALGNK